MSTSTNQAGHLRVGRLALVLCRGMGTLAACGVPGGNPPPPPAVCDSGPVGDPVGGPDANATVASVAMLTSIDFGNVRSCNDKTGTPTADTDVDVFRLPLTSGPGRLTVTCPAGTGVAYLNLLDSAGALLAQAPCNGTASTAFDLGVPAGQNYLEVDHLSPSVELTLSVIRTALNQPETDPLAITVPQTVAGSVGPGDLTDTITFTDPVGLLLFTAGCVTPLSFTITASFGGTVSTSAPIACDLEHTGTGSVSRDDGLPASIVVSAPAGATGPIAYVITIGG